MLGFGKKQLRGIRVAVLATDGVEQSEVSAPWKALQKAGAELYLVSPHKGKIQAVQGSSSGDRIPVDATLDEAAPVAFNALLLPGGMLNPERLRQDQKAIDFVRTFARQGKPIAASTHASWLLITAGLAQGRTLTSSPGMRDDIRNAGGTWKDEPVVVDENLLTMRGPKDIKKFSKAIVGHFAQQLGIA
jgi:protease I